MQAEADGRQPLGENPQICGFREAGNIFIPPEYTAEGSQRLEVLMFTLRHEAITMEAIKCFKHEILGFYVSIKLSYLSINLKEAVWHFQKLTCSKFTMRCNQKNTIHIEPAEKLSNPKKLTKSEIEIIEESKGTIVEDYISGKNTELEEFVNPMKIVVANSRGALRMTLGDSGEAARQDYQKNYQRARDSFTGDFSEKVMVEKNVAAVVNFHKLYDYPEVLEYLVIRHYFKQFETGNWTKEDWARAERTKIKSILLYFQSLINKDLMVLGLDASITHDKHIWRCRTCRKNTGSGSKKAVRLVSLTPTKEDVDELLKRFQLEDEKNKISDQDARTKSAPDQRKRRTIKQYRQEKADAGAEAAKVAEKAIYAFKKAVETFTDYEILYSSLLQNSR
ncbi:hypothetical protein B9Z55_007621 [Caenorhabditis nigoni]|uniref:Uncharacterized protein n=1 Tax=Caenorhabditis nigoni TaxID=1611254 RepID=A0A2G5VAF0_9PELO|nr:hypothetical protein B9Z55_007621 [Caenorhabditis nigoni]